MENPYESIKTKLANVKHEDFGHEKVYTSEQAADVRDGLSAANGAKSLLLKCGESFYLFIVPGDKRLDNKNVKRISGEKKIRFATGEEVVDIMGCEIGACYPFGSIPGIPMFVDEHLSKEEFIAFNPGVHDRTIILSWNSYLEVENPKLESLVKSEASGVDS